MGARYKCVDLISALSTNFSPTEMYEASVKYSKPRQAQKLSAKLSHDNHYVYAAKSDTSLKPDHGRRLQRNGNDAKHKWGKASVSVYTRVISALAVRGGGH